MLYDLIRLANHLDKIGLTKEADKLDAIVKIAADNQQTSMIDWGQRALDLVGLIPGYGEPFDGLNAVISIIRKNPVDAVLSIISMFPVYGDTIGKGGKLLIWANTNGFKTIKYGTKVYTISGFGVFLKAQLDKLNEPELMNVLDSADERIKAPKGSLYAVYQKDIKAVINSAALSEPNNTATT